MKKGKIVAEESRRSTSGNEPKILLQVQPPYKKLQRMLKLITAVSTASVSVVALNNGLARTPQMVSFISC